MLDAARQKDEASLRLQPQQSRQLLMPELPELEVVRDVLNRRIIGQTIVSAESIPPGGPIVVRDLTGEGFGAALAGPRLGSIARRGKFLVLSLAGTGGPLWLVINPKLTGW